MDLISRIGDDHLSAHLRTGTENGWSTKRRIRINSPYSTLRVCEKFVFLRIMDVRKEADMDQITTGKFIAEERKRKGYIQKQLAEILGIYYFQRVNLTMLKHCIKIHSYSNI